MCIFMLTVTPVKSTSHSGVYGVGQVITAAGPGAAAARALGAVRTPPPTKPTASSYAVSDDSDSEQSLRK